MHPAPMAMSQGPGARGCDTIAATPTAAWIELA